STSASSTARKPRSTACATRSRSCRPNNGSSARTTKAILPTSTSSDPRSSPISKQGLASQGVPGPAACAGQRGLGSRDHLSFGSACAVLRSRRGRRQDLLVLGVVLGVAEPGRYEEQIVVHFGPGEGLAELGNELPFFEMAGEDLELPEVLRRRLAHQVAAGALLAVLVEPLADHLVDGLGL